MKAAPGREARLALTLLGLVAALVGLSSVRSWDLWWHLLTGRVALETGSTLPSDVFSLTRAGEPWVYKDLGADLLLWVTYDALGVAGLVLFKALTALALMGLLALLARGRLEAVWGWLLLAGVGFVVVSFRVTSRPDVFSLLGLAGLLLWLARWRRSPAPRGVGWMLAVVGLMLLWANLHRGVVLGVAVLAGYALYELASLLERRLGRTGRWLPSVISAAESPGRELAKSGAVAAAAGLVTLANPSGLALWTQSLKVGGSELLPLAVSEWARLSPAELWTHFPMALIWMLAVAVLVPWGLVRVSRGGGDVDPFDLLLVGAALVLGLQAVRMLPLMVILSIGPLAGALGALSAGRVVGVARSAAVGMAAVVVAVVVAVAPLIDWPRPGLARDWYPEGAVRVMAEAPVAGQGFTTFTFAGYLLFHLWPQKRVLCDGRFDTVYDDATMAECLGAERDPELFFALRERHQLEWVLAHNRMGPPRDRARPRALDFLDGHPDWALIHWDAASLLYVRLEGPNGWLREPLGYEILRPREADVSLMEALRAGRGNPAVMARLESEVRRLQAAAPDDVRTLVLLALYLHGIGATDSAELDLVLEGLRLRRAEAPEAVDRVLEWVGRD